MSKRKRKSEAFQRERLHRDIERVRNVIERYRPLDQAERAALAREAQRLIHEAFDLRDDAARWEAITLFNRTIDIAYPTGFWDSYWRLKAGDPGGLEIAVTFLEDDPWFFRSGYAKERLLRFIKRVDIPERYLPRLERVLLNAVDSRNRREFRQYCHLARALGSEQVRKGLERRLTSEDCGIRQRARWMLGAMNDDRSESN